MKTGFVFIISVLFYSCSREIEEIKIEKSTIPEDYFSDDGNVSIIFHKNGALKEVTVVSDKYDVPYDPNTGLGGTVFITQRLSYDSNQVLQTVHINANDNATFWYDKDESESICYNCDSTVVVDR